MGFGCLDHGGALIAAQYFRAEYDGEQEQRQRDGHDDCEMRFEPGQHDGGDNNDLGDQRCDHEDEVEQ